MKQQKGFTLIELVVVIVILGVLAAVALPRFMNATSDAHSAAVSGTGGALAAGVALVRSQWELNRVKGNDTTPNLDVTGFGDGLVDVSAKGWPMADDAASTLTVPGSADRCKQVWDAVLQGSAPTVATGGTTADYLAEADANGCKYTYRLDGGTTAASIRSVYYNATNGVVTIDADE